MTTTRSPISYLYVVYTSNIIYIFYYIMIYNICENSRQVPLPLRRNKRTLYDAHPVIMILANELQEHRRPSWLRYLPLIF